VKNINICGLIYLLESSRRAYIGDWKWRKSAGKLDDTERLRILGWLRALNFALNFLRRGYPPNLAKFTRSPPPGLAPVDHRNPIPPGTGILEEQKNNQKGKQHEAWTAIETDSAENTRRMQG